MGPIRAVIAEDEPLQRKLLRTMLAEEPDIRVVAEAADGAATVQAIRDHRPELIFLDVQMPELDAFQIVSAVGLDRMPVTIFVTAFDQYALRAFEVHALDYLLKPFDGDRLSHAVRRAVAQVRQAATDGAGERLTSILREIGERRAAPARLALRADGRVLFVDTAAIDFIEAAGKLVRVHAGRERHEVRDTLKALATQLDPGQFVQVHRSTIVNVSRIREIQSWFQGDYVLILRDGTRITTGRAYRPNVQQLMRGGSRREP